MGADVREVLSVRQSGDEIEVTGVVSDSDLKQEIMDRIGTLDHVTVQIQSGDHLATQASSQPPIRLGQTGGQNYDAPAKQWLEQQYPEAADREGFVHRALQLNHAISVRAYALSQLATRYPAAAFNALSPSAKARIAHIVADLATEIDDDEEALRAHLRPLVIANNLEPPPVAWQSATTQCLAFARGVDYTLASLFAASPQQPSEFNSLVEQLRSQLTGVCRIGIE